MILDVRARAAGQDQAVLAGIGLGQPQYPAGLRAEQDGDRCGQARFEDVEYQFESGEYTLFFGRQRPQSVTFNEIRVKVRHGGFLSP